MSPPAPKRAFLPGVTVLIVVAELVAYDFALVGLAVAAFGIAVAAVLVHVAIPRTDPAAHGLLAISFAATALFTTVAFWSALPFAFGAAAIVARPRSISAGVGGLAMIVATVFCILA